MADGAVGTITKVLSKESGQIFFDLITMVGDSAYPTNGSTGFLAAFQAALGVGRSPIAVIGMDNAGYHLWYDVENDKMKVFYGDNNNASDGPHIEVPNTTVLSGVTHKFWVMSI